MSLLTALRAGVAVADKITKPLQPTVLFRRFLGSDEYGTPTYDPPADQPARSMRAIVDWKQRQVRTLTGELSVSRAMVLFLDVNEVATATANEGIGDEDVIVLPDETTGPILDMAGFIDAGTGRPLATEVYLG